MKSIDSVVSNESFDDDDDKLMTAMIITFLYLQSIRIQVSILTIQVYSLKMCLYVCFCSSEPITALVKPEFSFSVLFNN